MYTKLVYLLSLCFLLLGCNLLNTSSLTQPKQPVRIGLKLAPAALEETISVQQHLTIERAGQTDELDTALEIEPQKLALVGMVLGQRVMTIQYDGKTLQTWRHPMMPKQLRGEDVLEDLQLTLWPTPAIRHALPSGWRIEEQGYQRTLLLNDTPIITINYSTHRRWMGKIVLTNLRYHYRLIIHSVTTTSQL